MKNIHANLRFLPAPSTVCEWEDEILKIIRSAKKSLRIYWREGFWYFQFDHHRIQHALQEAYRELGVVIEIVVGPLWLSVEEGEKNSMSQQRLSYLAESGIVRVYLLSSMEKHKRFIVVDDCSTFSFEDPNPPRLPRIQEAMSSVPCNIETLQFFDARTKESKPCFAPQEHLLIVEAFEYNFLIELELLDRKPEEIKQLIEQEKDRLRRLYQEIADAMPEIHGQLG